MQTSQDRLPEPSQLFARCPWTTAVGMYLDLSINCHDYQDLFLVSAYDRAIALSTILCRAQGAMASFGNRSRKDLFDALRAV